MKRPLILGITMLILIMLTGCEHFLSTTDPNQVSSNTTTIDSDAINDRYIIPDELSDCLVEEITDNYKIVFCDEFNYEGMLDSSKWNYEIGNGSYGWGNGELQYYTNRSDNSYVSDGNLTITAKREEYGGCDYTSARITTKNKFDFTYGYIEVRAMMPVGVGTWPAIWMMPTDSVYGGWPNSGEIDILETTGKNANTAYSTIHTESFNHSIGTQKGGNKFVANMQTAYQIYGLKWTEDELLFTVNGLQVFKFNLIEGWKNLEDYSNYWPFDQNFFLILNVAMGGSWGGNVDSEFESGEMKIDYVRIYQQANTEDTEAPEKATITSSIASASTINLAWDEPIDNYGIRYYKVVLDNDIYGATTSLKYTITDLEPNTTYMLRIMAVDWNDNYSVSYKVRVTTTGIVELPTNINAVNFANASAYNFVSGNDGGIKDMLQLSGQGYATYQVSSSIEKTYTLSMRSAVTRSTSISVYSVSGENEILLLEKNLASSYGSYNTIEIGNISLSSGTTTLKIVVDGSADTNYLLINYINISE